MFQFHIVYIVTDIIGFYINGKSQNHLNVRMLALNLAVFTHTRQGVFAFTSGMNRVRWKLCKKKLWCNFSKFQLFEIRNF